MFRLLALVVLLVAAPALGQPVLLQQLSSPTPTPESRFGSAVAIGGDAVVVGQPGEAGAVGRAFAYVRAPGSGTWEFEAELFPDSLEDAGEFKPAFGAAVAFDGPYALVGAPYESSGVVNSGAAYLFRKDDETGAWTDVARFKPPVPVLRDQFGAAVAISGATVAIGAHGNDEAGENAGAVYVFERTGEGAWTFTQTLVPDAVEAGDGFGFSLGLRGDVLVVGIANDLAPDDPGAAYVFERTGEGAEPWEQTQKLGAEVAEPGEAFGFDVAVDGTTILVGAPLSDPADQGAAYIFERTGGAGPWEQTQRLIAMAPQTNAQFGASVRVDGDRAVVGAPLDGTQAASGAAYTFERTDSVWAPAHHLVAGEPEEGALFGIAVALRAGLTVVGSPDAGAGSVGAAYVFSLLPTAAEGDTAADGFGLAAPYPNPVRASATVTYTLPATGDVTLSAFDVLGREVAVLAEGRRPAGPAAVRWDTRGLPAGVYFVRLVSADRTATRRVLVVR